MLPQAAMSILHKIAVVSGTFEYWEKFACFYPMHINCDAWWRFGARDCRLIRFRSEGEKGG